MVTYREPLVLFNRISITLLALTSISLVACSLSRAGHTECTNNAECRAAFGLGVFCGKKGYCRTAPVPPRCQETYPDDLLSAGEQYADYVVIGSLQDRAVLSKRGRERAVRLAFSQANIASEQEGLEVSRFGVVFCTDEENQTYDDLSRTQAALTNANYLVSVLNVPAIIGPSASPDVVAIFPSLGEQGDHPLLISPAASSILISNLDDDHDNDPATPGLLWRTAPPDSIQAEAIVHDMWADEPLAPDRESRVTDVAVVYETGAYGQGLFDAFVANYPGDILAPSNYPDSRPPCCAFSSAGERNEAVVDAADNAAQEVLFIAQTEDTIALVESAAVLESYDEKTLFVTDTAANSDFLSGVSEKAATKLFSRVRGTQPARMNTSDPVYDTFRVGYRAEYDNEDPEPLSFTAHAYDAGWLVLYGAVWAEKQTGQINGPGIAAGLAQVSDKTAPEVVLRPGSWKTVVSDFTAGNAIDVRGSSGALDFDEVNGETVGNIDIWTIGADRSQEVRYTWTPPSE